MKPLLYLLRKQYKNTFLQVVKKPTALIGYIIMLAFMSFNSIMILFNDETGSFTQTSQEIYVIGVSLFIMMIVLPGVYGSIQKVSLALKSADVSMLFTGPFKPAHILLYSQINQSLVSMAVTIFMVIQAPLLYKMVGLNVTQIVFVFLSWLVLLLVSTPINMAIYTLCQRTASAKMVARVLFFGSIACVILWLGYTAATGDHLLADLASVLGSDIYGYVPIVGWFMALFSAAVFGMTTATYVVIGLLILSVVVSIWVVMHYSTTDFYEEAANNSEKVEAIREAQKNGQNTLSLAFGRKKKGAKSVDFAFTKTGAGAIRQMRQLEYKKTTFFMLSFRSLVMVALALGLAYLFNQDPDTKNLIFMAVPIGAAYMLFITSMSIKGDTLAKHYIYQIPDTDSKKLFALYHYPALKLAIEAYLGALLIAVVYGRFSPDMLVAPLIVVVFGMELELLNLITTNIIGKIGTQMLRVYVNMFITMMSLIPGVLVAIIVAVMEWPIMIAYILIIATILIVDVVLFFLAKRTFKNAEVYA